MIKVTLSELHKIFGYDLKQIKCGLKLSAFQTVPTKQKKWFFALNVAITSRDQKINRYSDQRFCMDITSL